MSIESDYAIYNAILRPYFKEDLQLGRKYSSPLKGRRDSAPSFQVNKKKDCLKWIDYGGKKEWADVYSLLMGIHGVNFYEAKQMLEGMDFPPAVKVKLPKTIEFRPVWGSLNYSEYLVWDEFNIRPSSLSKYKVKGARQLWCNGKLVYDYLIDPPAFFYVGENKTDWQFYCPVWKKRKKSLAFVRNGRWVLGYEQLPLAGETLYIVSGMKDGLCTYECGYPFLAGSGEGDLINFHRLLPELRLRFKNIYTLFDPDEAGRKATEDFQKAFGIPPAPFKYPNQKDDIAKLSSKLGIKWLRDGLRIH